MLLPRPKAPKLILRENCYFLPEGSGQYQLPDPPLLVKSARNIGGVRYLGVVGPNLAPKKSRLRRDFDHFRTVIQRRIPKNFRLRRAILPRKSVLVLRKQNNPNRMAVLYSAAGDFFTLYSSKIHPTTSRIQVLRSKSYPTTSRTQVLG